MAAGIRGLLLIKVLLYFLFQWLPEVKYHNPQAPIILVGNKEDLRELNKISGDMQKCRQHISTTEAMNLAQKAGAFRYVECSAKTHRGVKSVFDAAIMAVISPNITKPKKSWCRII